MGGSHCRRGAARATGAMVAGLVVATVLLGAARAAGERAAAQFDAPQLGVDYASLAGHSFLVLSLDLQGQGIVIGDAPPIAAAVQVNVPAGFQLDLAKAPGTTIGQLTGGIEGASNGAGFAFSDADIVVDDPATYAADPIAQACAPGPHTAVWRASFSVLGPSIALPIAVDIVSGAGATSAYTVRFCPFRSPSATLPNGATFLLLSALLQDEVTAPVATGTYSWSALVTPATQYVADPTRTFELRAVLPVPHVFTLDAQYDANTRSAVLTGKLTAAGKPQAGAVVTLVARDRNDNQRALGEVRTDASGAFRVRRSFVRTSEVEVSADRTAGACPAPSTAPGGCLSETVAAPESASTTVIVPRRTDARLAVRARDQALARRSIVAPGDLPPDWRDATGPPGPCALFTPDLRQLTVTGQAFSRLFVAPDISALTTSTASVYVNRESAITAFGRVAQAAAARCEAAEVSSDAAALTSLSPLTFAKVGDAARAFRAVVTTPDGTVNVDLVFVRVGRVVLEIDVYGIGTAQDGLEAQLARAVASRARRQ